MSSCTEDFLKSPFKLLQIFWNFISGDAKFVFDVEVMAIAACRKSGKYVGICGQGPSDHPDLAKWLMEQGIDSVSLNPDTVVQTWLYLAGRELEV